MLAECSHLDVSRKSLRFPKLYHDSEQRRRGVATAHLDVKYEQDASCAVRAINAGAGLCKHECAIKCRRSIVRS